MEQISNLNRPRSEGDQESGLRERFQEVIREIMDEHEEDFSTDWDDYTPFQRAVCFGQIEMCRALIAEGEVGDFKENTVSLFTMISLLVERGDYNTALFLIKKMPLEDQSVIVFILGKENFVFLDFVWGDLAESVQENTVLYFEKAPDVVIALFQKSTDRVQKRIFLFSLAWRDAEQLNLSLWQKMNPSLKRALILDRGKKDVSMLEKVMSCNRRKLILAMLEEIPSMIHSISNKGLTSLEYGIGIEKKLGREIVERLREKDAGFTEEIIICQLCWHQLKLEGGIFDTGPIDPLAHLVPKMVAEALQKYAEKYANLIEILDYNETDPKLLAGRALHQPMLIDSSWRGHATRWLILQNKGDLICVKIDTGVSEFRGIGFYKIHKKEGLESAIATSQQQQGNHSSVGYLFFNEALDQILSLEFVCHFWDEQIGNSCSISSLDRVIDAIFYTDELAKEGLDLNVENLKTCMKNVQAKRTLCAYLLQIGFCNKAMPIMQKYAEDPRIRDALVQVIERQKSLMRNLYC